MNCPECGFRCNYDHKLYYCPDCGWEEESFDDGGYYSPTYDEYESVESNEEWEFNE